MRNKFKGESCVYCNEAKASTSDHVICRQFFLVKQRANLPQVPACSLCNNEKSSLENYLTVLLPFGGRHADASETLSTMVPKRLAKNAKLHRELAVGLAKSGGVSLPLDHTRLDKLFALIARGLAWHAWKVRLGQQHSAIASIFHDSGAAFFDQMINRWNTPHRVFKDLGEGTFVYQGAQATDCAEMTVWRFWMYGGTVFGGDPRLPGPASVAVAVTGPLALVSKLQRIGRRSPMI
jgi:hypothetical protein